MDWPDTVIRYFYRTTDRKSPHNAYTSFEGIQKGIEINGYSQEYAEDFQPGYAFCGVDDEVELPGETEANVVKPGYFLNEPWFEYNRKTNCTIVSSTVTNRLIS